SPHTKIWLGRGLTYHAMFCYRSGDLPHGRMAIEESIAILRQLDMPQFLIEPLVYSSIIYALMGNFPAAQANVNEGVALARQFNDTWFLAVGIFNQGVQFRLLGEPQRAYESIKEALRLWREMGNPPRLTGLAHNFLSAIAIELDKRSEAREYLEESLKLASTNTDRWGLGSALSGFGVLALREGDTVAAENYVGQSIAVFTELGARADLAESLNLFGKLHLYRSEFVEAQVVLKKAIRLGLELNSAPQVCQAALEFADCLVNLDRPEAALTILRAVPAPALKVESVRRRVEQIKGDLEAQYPGNGKDIELPSMTFEELLPRFLKE
ncbi:MAG TPA: tetratricopeptide repeat protein, partial [Anaerolineales bacterium]|nr:tetratricopeptide repeat protein [Anaerolineales bacterium]